MPPPQVVLFDVLSTLVVDPFRTVMPDFFGLSLEELIAQKHPTAWIHFEDGTWDEETFFTHFFADGRTFDHGALKQALFDAYRFENGMENLLNELRDRGFGLHLVSNYPSWYVEIELRLQLTRWAPWTFVSVREGMRKPDRRVFEWIAEELNVPANACVLVDDRKENCEAAREVGMEAWVFEGVEGLRGRFREWGLVR